ncbi:hypothetical protein EOC99_32900, partial [Mesorhizobium sp. M7A.T.Ca.TU.009.01.1.1]
MPGYLDKVFRLDPRDGRRNAVRRHRYGFCQKAALSLGQRGVFMADEQKGFRLSRRLLLGAAVVGGAMLW